MVALPPAPDRRAAARPREHVVHLLAPGKQQEHKPMLEAERRGTAASISAAPSSRSRAGYATAPREARRSSSRWKYTSPA